MVETGATPKVSFIRRTVTRVGRVLTNPLLPDDYFALVKPTWSTREATGTVVKVAEEPGGAATIVIRPDFEWTPHRCGQYLRIGMEINGKRHWRAYSLTSDPHHPRGLVSITVKRTKGGLMSPALHRVALGQRVYLGDVEGEFTLPDPLPKKMLFISAGSGITPIMSMLRELERRSVLDDDSYDVIHLHSARSADDMTFGEMLREFDERNRAYHLAEWHTSDEKRFGVDDLAKVAKDYTERETFVSGPRELIDAIEEHYDDKDLGEHLHMERFQPVIGNGGGAGDGGSVHFRVSDGDAQCEPGQSILVGGEEAGLNLTFGCRMGICHTCVGRLQDGAIRDLRTGSVEQASGQMVRICVNAPEGHVEIDL